MKAPTLETSILRARRIERSTSAQRPILFGTSGWRGALGEEVTFPRLRVLARSIADWIHQCDAGNQVLVAWDRRIASRAMAEMTTAILCDSGLVPRITSRDTPTPALTHALAHGSYAAGISLTASHNPALDHGLKVFRASGATITDAESRRIEAIASARMRDDGPALSRPTDDREDLLTPYRESLVQLIDSEAISRSDLVVVYDAMHGSGAGVLDSVLESAGAEVRTLRTIVDPTFGGESPDPCPDHLGTLAAATARAGGLAIGLATDGDADRFGVVDGRGRALSETQVLALLVDHLASSGQLELDRGIAISEGTGSLVERVAASHDLLVERHPVGFKHLSAAIEAGRVELGGEESGGFALARSGPDKDGILAGCLVANLVATSGENLEDHIDRLESRFGVSACGRRAIPRSKAAEHALARLETRPPESVDGIAARPVGPADAFRLEFEDGGFLMLRCSGTESVMRIYAEANSEPELERRLEAGSRLLEPTIGMT